MTIGIPFVSVLQSIAFLLLLVNHHNGSKARPAEYELTENSSDGLGLVLKVEASSLTCTFPFGIDENAQHCIVRECVVAPNALPFFNLIRISFVFSVY